MNGWQMKRRLMSWCVIVSGILALTALPGFGVTYHRSFRNGYPAGAQGASGSAVRTVGVTTNAVKLTGGFAKFRNKTWVTGSGTVTRILDDDLEPPCHQRFILSDGFGRTVLVAHNIDEWDRLADVEVGDVIAFKGEFVSNPRGGVVHWTHPDKSHRKPGGWLKKLKGAEKDEPVEAAELAPPDERKEYFAGRGPMSTRLAAPVNDDWPETGYWLSTNSGARHNRGCENYRKTRGYPCKKSEGRPCGKCGG